MHLVREETRIIGGTMATGQPLTILSATLHGSEY